MDGTTLADSPQTPTGGRIFLDHIGWFVPDIEAAGRQLERLGFRLTPFVAQHNADPAGGPPRPAGTGNRCAMLRRGYLEFLAAIPGADTPLSAQLTAALGRYTGLHLIAFTVADPAAAHARLEEEGFEPLPPVHLRRPIELPTGGMAEVAFTVLRVPPHAMAEGRVQMLKQETPELVWQDGLLARENGVTGLAGVLLCVADPTAVAERYARFTGRPAAGDPACRVIDLDRGRLVFATAAWCGRHLPGVEAPTLPFIAAALLQAEDPGVLRALCEARGIRLLPGGDDTVCVHPAEAAGAALMVAAAGSSWPF